MNDESTQDLSSNETQTNLVALIQGIGAQLTALQVKVDERLYDTRPLWESVQGQINDLRFDTEQGFREARAEVQELRAESKADMEKLNTELSRELRHVSYSLDTLHGKMLRYDTIQRDIENRIREIEGKAS